MGPVNRKWLEEIRKLEQKVIEAGVDLDLDLPRDRKCPTCGKTQTKRMAWVVYRDNVPRGLRTVQTLAGNAVCKSCAQRAILLDDEHGMIDGTKVRAARQAGGMEMKELAMKCGWSVSYQSRIERSTGFLITRESLAKIMKNIPRSQRDFLWQYVIRPKKALVQKR